MCVHVCVNTFSTDLSVNLTVEFQYKSQYIVISSAFQMQKMSSWKIRRKKIRKMKRKEQYYWFIVQGKTTFWFCKKEKLFYTLKTKSFNKLMNRFIKKSKRKLLYSKRLQYFFKFFIWFCPVVNLNLSFDVVWGILIYQFLIKCAQQQLLYFHSSLFQFSKLFHVTVHLFLSQNMICFPLVFGFPFQLYV